IGGTATTTAPVFFSLTGTSASSNRLILGQNQNLDVVIGAATSSGLNTLFQLSGNDLYVQGNIGSATSVYTNGYFIAGSGSTLYGNGVINKNDGSLAVSSSADITVNSNTGFTAETAIGSLTLQSRTSGDIILDSAIESGGTIRLGLDALDRLVIVGSIQSDLVSFANDFNDLGSPANSWKSLYTSSTIHAGSGVSSTGNITPFANNLYDLGGFGRAWRDIYASTTVYGGAIVAATGTVTAPTLTFGGFRSAGFYTDGTAGRTNLASNASEIWRADSVSGFGLVAPIYPVTNNTYDIGTGLLSFGNIFSSGTVRVLTDVVVGGSSVCLANGTNCPAGVTGSDDWAYSATNDFVRPNTNTTSLVIGAYTAPTAPFWFLNQTTSSRLTLGGNGSSTNVVIGGTTSTVSNTLFQLDGNDLFVAGNIGSASSVYTNGAFIAGSGSTYFGNGFVSRTDGVLNFQVSASSVMVLNQSGVTTTGSVVPSVNNTYHLGSGAASWGGVFASGTSFFATNTLMIDGTNGRIGVSTTSPGVKFDVVADTASTGLNQFRISNSSGGATGTGITLDAQNAGSGKQFNIISTGSGASVGAGTLAFHDGNSSSFRLMISSAGHLLPGANNTYNLGGFGNAWSNLFVSSTAFLSSVTSTNATSTNLAFTSASGSSLLLNSLTLAGQSVCLADGTNCQSSSGGSDDWTYNSTNDFIRPNTNTSSLIIGAFTQQTAPFWFLNQTTSSRLTLGGNGSSTNFVLGGTTSTITNTAFQLDGNDLFVAGNIGSASSVYTNGSFITGSGSTHFGDGFITKTNGNLSVSSSGNVVLLMNDNFGVGTSTPSEKLTVVGNIQNTLVTNQTFTTASSTGTDVAPQNVIVQGKYAYVVNFTAATLQIFDVSDPQYPTSTGSVSTTSSPAEVAVAGRYAYVVAANRLNVFDVSDPTRPSQIASLAVTATESSERRPAIYVSGNRAYITDANGSTFTVVDITSPTRPSILSTRTFGLGLTDVFVSGRYAYVTSWSLVSGNNFFILDVSTSSPALVSSSNTDDAGVADGGPFAVYVQGRYAYVANQFIDTMSVIDISNPLAPVVKDEITVGDSPEGIHADGRYVYTSSYGAGTDGVSVIDVASSTLAVELTKIPTTAGATPSSIFVSGRYAYVTQEGNNVLRIIDIKGTEVNGLTAASAEVGTLQIRSNGFVSNDFTIAGSLNVGIGGIMTNGAIFAQGGTSTFMGGVSTTRGVFSDGIFVQSQTFTVDTNVGVGTSTPSEKLTVVGNIQNTLVSGQTFTTASTTITGTSPQSVIVQGKYAYVVNFTDATLEIFDVSDPQYPTSTGSVSTTSSPAEVAVAGRYAYVVAPSRLNVFDVSDPTRPSAIASIAVTASEISDRRPAIYVSGNRAYITDANGTTFSVVDITNPTRPTVLSTRTFGSGLTDVFVSGRYAYVTSYSLVGNKNLFVLDISTSSPALVGSINTAENGTGDGGPLAVYVQGRYAYVANQFLDTMSVVDISNPLAPVVKDEVTVGDAPSGIHADGRYVYTASYGNGTDGVSIVDVASSTLAVAVASIPTTGLSNPNSIFVSGRYAYVTQETNNLLRIIDIKGTEVNGLTAASAEVGTLQIRSNGFVSNDFTIAGSLTVGTGGIITNGSLFVSGATSTFLTSVSTTQLIVSTTGTFMSALGVGTSTPSEKLTVVGNIQNTLVNEQSFNFLSTTSTGTDPSSVMVQGRYAYVTNNADDTLDIYDVSDPSLQSRVARVSSVTNGGAPNDLFVAGRYAYVLGGNGTLTTVDVSTTTAPIVKSRLSGLSASALAAPARLAGLFVSGKYAYITDAGGTTFSVVDISNAASSSLIATRTFGNKLQDVYVQGRYAYVVSWDQAGSNNFFVVDVSNPNSPLMVGQENVDHGITTTDDGPIAVTVQGRYAYVANQFTDTFSIIDVSSPTTPSSTAEIAVGGEPRGVHVVGRYVYLTNNEAETISVIDVASSTNPIVRTTISTGAGSGPFDPFVAGRFLYVTRDGDEKLSIIDLGGIETTGLIAPSAELGALQIRNNAVVGNQLSVVGALNVGTQGILSNGPISAFDYGSSTFSGAIYGLSNCGGSENGNILTLATDSDSQRMTVRCSGQIFSDNGTVGTPGDYAEYFPTSDTTLTTGEVVAMTGASASSVKRAMSGDREFTLGVISANPLVLGNAGPDGAHESNPNYKIVGLLGQLPVKASDANGPISAGDKLIAGDNGYAVKSSGVGMVIGQAMESLTSSTGMIKAYVNPEWSGDGIFESATGTTNVLAQGTASTSTTTYDSHGLTFQGSAWDGTSVLTSSFTLRNDVISSTSSLFTIQNTSGTSLLTISDVGSASVTQDLSVGGRLYLGSKLNGVASTSTYLFIDDSLAPSSTYIATNADGWSTQATYDYAERFISFEKLVPGDLVTADPTGVNQVKRATSPNDAVLGIVSTKPGFITGAHATDTYPIALAGRVPTRVSTANGAIAAGDQLAPSNVPGVAVKAVTSGPVIGIALESYDAPAEGSVSVFVQPGWKGGEMAGDSYNGNVAAGVSPRSGLAKIAAGAKEVNVSFTSLNSFPLITATPYDLPVGQWGIRNVTDHGFTLVLEQIQTVDIVFSWKAEPSQDGSVMSFSDGTSATYDPLTGQPIVSPVAAPEPESEPVAGPSSEPDPQPEAAPPSDPQPEAPSEPPAE
ncbi:hypothetical protein HY479_04255, partial [Candidatus Uhrbacteria bacterium]|nr:hypothetical protein [Candidatus Uhrbacteria bacterium]